MFRNNSCIVREFTQARQYALKSFSEKFLPQVDRSKFLLELSLEGETIRIHICANLPGLNSGYTIGEFCKSHRDEVLSAIVATGEGIQFYQFSCEELEFHPQNARSLIKALSQREKLKGCNN